MKKNTKCSLFKIKKEVTVVDGNDPNENENEKIADIYVGKKKKKGFHLVISHSTEKLQLKRQLQETKEQRLHCRKKRVCYRKVNASKEA